MRSFIKSFDTFPEKKLKRTVKICSLADIVSAVASMLVSGITHSSLIMTMIALAVTSLLAPGLSGMVSGAIASIVFSGCVLLMLIPVIVGCSPTVICSVIFEMTSLIVSFITIIFLLLSPFRNTMNEDSLRFPSYHILKPDHIYLFSECFVMYFFRSLIINGGIYAVCGFIVAAIIMMAMYVVTFIRLDSETGFLLFRSVHKKREDAAEIVAESRAEQSCIEVFERLKQYFDDEHPYLNMDLTIYDVAHRLLTNKVYISKAVNMYADKNFCQFVNYYRIKYALDIFERDPDIRLGQLAQQSGFRTLATFNMAFKLNVNESPGEWCRRRRMQLKSSYKF